MPSLGADTLLLIEDAAEGLMEVDAVGKRGAILGTF